MKKTGRFFICISILSVCASLGAQSILFMYADSGDFTYDPETGTSGTVNLYMYHMGAATDYYVMFSEGNSGQGNFAPRTLKDTSQHAIEYNLYDNLADRHVLKDDTAAPLTNEDVLHGTMTKAGFFGHLVTATFAYHVPPSAPYQGRYTDSITISVCFGTVPGPDTVAKSMTWNISSQINAVLSVFVGETWQPFEEGVKNLILDFQELTTGEEISARIMVGANVPYTISVTSDNGGKLVNPAGIKDAENDNDIDYEFFCNEEKYTFTGAGIPVQLDTLNSQLPTEDIYPVRIKIGTVDLWQDIVSLYTGTYTDRITVTVAAQ